MFGAVYFGQEEFGEPPEEIEAVAITGGGGWSHRGPVKLPQRRSPEFKAPVFKKPTPYRW